LTLAKVEEIKSWLAHDKLLGEFDNRAADEILHLAGIAGLQGVQIPYSMPGALFRNAGMTVFRYLEIEAGSLPLALDDRDTDYLVLHIPRLSQEEQEQLRQWCEDYSILLQLPADTATVLNALQQLAPAGIAVDMTDEIRPGVQEFDNMLDLLEALEEG
jgi:hypothetical protein